MPNLHNLAEFWMGHGAKVLPCHENKAPVSHLAPKGFHDASDNPSDLWRFEHDDVGYVGLVPGSMNCVVLDVDVKGGARGDATLAEWENEHGAIPKGAMVPTPSGGFHIWLRKPVIHSTGRIGNHVFTPGVDVRADGGYVIAPGNDGYGALPRNFAVEMVPLMPTHVAEYLIGLQAAEDANVADYDISPQQQAKEDWNSKVERAYSDGTSELFNGSDRHTTMIETVNRLASHELLGYAGATTALEMLKGEFVEAVSDRSATGEAAREYARALNGARQRVTSRESSVLEARTANDTFLTAIKAAAQATVVSKPEVVPEPEPPHESEDEFWEARTILTHARSVGWAMRKGPWAVLGCILVRACMHIPPWVVVPMRAGIRGSGIPLNIYVAAVGHSGQGKGGAVKGAKLAMTWPADDQISFAEVDLGSGEGLLEQYGRIDGEGNLEQFRTAVGFECNEVDAFGATKGRSGSTLEPVIRSAWSGEALGFAYRGKRVRLAENKYRIGIIMGVQPEKAGALVGADATGGGTPQRFNFLPLADPGSPDELPVMPTPLTWEPPRWPAMSSGPFSDGLAYLDVAPEIHEEIDKVQLSDLRGQTQEGHEPQSRLRIAAVLAVLDGRINVNVEDWDIAGEIRRTSNTTSDFCRAEAKAAAHKEAARNDLLRQAARVGQDRVSQRLLSSKSLLGGGEWRSRGDLNRTLAQDEREALDTALSYLVVSGMIVQRKKGRGMQYRIAGDVPE